MAATNYEYIISEGSCNGEEQEFKSFVEKQHPEWDVKIETTLNNGLFIDGEKDEDFAQWDTLWEDYCSQPAECVRIEEIE